VAQREIEEVLAARGQDEREVDGEGLGVLGDAERLGRHRRAPVP
jgi:hypothetical protein